MRLIDADAFKNVLISGGWESVDINISKNEPLGEIVDTVIQAYRKCLFAELEKAPTAYDADKVIANLKDSSIAHAIAGQQFGADGNVINEKIEQAIGRGLDAAIEIVKGGLTIN